MDHILYTDGGSHNNGPRKGIGSYAFLEPVDLSNDYVDIYGEYYTDTTNNRTEMLAIIHGIRNIKLNDDKADITVVSDSGYVVNGWTDSRYLERWQTNGWITSTKDPVMNRDLWEMMLSLSWHTVFNFIHIKGHNKDNNKLHAFWNSIVDVACTFIMNSIDHVQENKQYHLRYNFKSKKIELVMEKYFFTFCSDGILGGYCQPIVSSNFSSARDLMVELHGTAWAFQYSEDQWSEAKLHAINIGYRSETELETIYDDKEYERMSKYDKPIESEERTNK